MAAPPSRVAGLASLVLLVATGSYGILFWLTRDRGPALEAFPRAAAVIREHHQPGDLIFLVPGYATRAREVLGDLQPLTVADPLAEDLSVHPRLWVFGLFGEAERLAPRMLAAGLTRSEHHTPAPGITFDLYATGARSRVVYDFMANLRRAKVYHEQPQGPPVPCAAWNDMNGQNGRFGRWQCPHDLDWFYVAPEWHRMGDEMRFCLWAHPPNQGRLVIAFPDVPLAGLLAGRAGHTAHGSAYARAPIDLDVQVGTAAQRFTFELDENFRPFLLDVPETGTATVTFAVSTRDAGTNHFCFVADMRTR